MSDDLFMIFLINLFESANVRNLLTAGCGSAGRSRSGGIAVGGPMFVEVEGPGCIVTEGATVPVRPASAEGVVLIGGVGRGWRAPASCCRAEVVGMPLGMS